MIAAIFLLPVSAADAPDISAKSGILIDGTGGRVLWEKDADKRSLIASTTKVMTCIVAIEQLNPKDRVLMFSKIAFVKRGTSNPLCWK